MTKKQLREKLKNDPNYFVEAVLGDSLWEKQREILEAVRDNRTTVVRSCHGAGKSYIAARTALWFLYTNKDSIVATTAPTFRQVQEILWREINSALANSKIALEGDISRTSINIAPKHFAIGLSTDEPNKFQGLHSKRVLFIGDEAAGIPEEIFEAANGILTGQDDRMLLIGNPTSLAGTFYDAFHQPSTYKIHIDYKDTPNIKAQKTIIPGLLTQEWVDAMVEEWGIDNPVFQSRVLGQFPEQGSDTLIPLLEIEKAVTRELETGNETFIGVDVARYGTDKTVFVIRKGENIEKIEKYSLEDTMQTSGRVKALLMLYNNAIARVDEVGVGAGVVDSLKEQGVKVQGINVGESAVDSEHFVNKRAENYWNLRTRFLEGRIAIPDDSELISQLANLKYKYTSKGQIQIESKEDMKKRGMKSPDVADALMLAFSDRDKKFEGLLAYQKQETEDGTTRQPTESLIAKVLREGTRL